MRRWLAEGAGLSDYATSRDLKFWAMGFSLGLSVGAAGGLALSALLS